MSEDWSDAIGSSWWIQLIFFIVANGMIYGLMEWWRYYPFIWGYITILGNFGLMPLAILSDNVIFLKIKYFIISPVLIVLTLWRIAYIPCNDDEPKWKLLISKLSRFIGKYLCCLNNAGRADKMIVNTTKCMEIFLWITAFVNIIIAAIYGFMDGIYMNSICGVILSLTIPIPAKLLHKKNGYYVANGELYDAVAPIHWLWIITFTSWDWCYVWHYRPNGIFLASFHLLPDCIRAFINKRYELYLGIRVFCLAMFLWIQSPVVLSQKIPWFLNPQNFPFFIDVSTNHRYVFEIIGSINFIFSSIHLFIFIKNIIHQRQIDKEKIRIKSDSFSENQQLYRHSEQSVQ